MSRLWAIMCMFAYFVVPYRAYLYCRMLCDHASAGSVQCQDSPGRCIGAAPGFSWDDDCFTNHIWSASPRGDGYYQGFHLCAASLNPWVCTDSGRCPIVQAFSVRLLPLSLGTLSTLCAGYEVWRKVVI